MKQLNLFISSLLLFMSVSAFADKVTVNATEFEPGGSVDISVYLDNNSVVSGYTMRLDLPEGFNVIYDDTHKNYIYELSNRHEIDYSMTIEESSDGSYLFVVYPKQSGGIIKSNSGILFTTRLSVAPKINASKMACLKSIVVSDEIGKETTVADAVFDLKKKASPITVVAKSYSRQYGEANPTLGYDAVGGKLTGTPFISCEATATSPVGEYDIIVTEGSVTSPNVTYMNGTLTITKAPLTISVGNYTMKQGEAMPNFTLNYDGFRNNETATVLLREATISCQATKTSEPGQYPIIVSGADAENYQISYISGILTVTSLIMGDVNGDGKVTITDAVGIVNYLLNNPAANFNELAADMNGDGSITITDAVGVVNKILQDGSSVRELMPLLNSEMIPE